MTTSVQATGRIKIIKMPKGEAPEWVRAAWIGMVLPCDPYVGFPIGGLERGVVSGKRLERNFYGFSVPQKEAIECLSKMDSEAAMWWQNNGFPQSDDACFGFSEDEAEIISGVTYQKLRRVTEDDHGDPDR